MKRDPYLERVRRTVAARGWVVQGVTAEAGDDVPFAYTVGMIPAGLPELVLSGLPMEVLHELINIAADAHLGQELTAGGTAEGLASVPLRVIACDPGAPVGVARALYGPAVTAVQLVWPDRDGAFPGEPGWRTAARQDLFGTPWWTAETQG